MHHRGNASGSRLRRAWDQPTLPLQAAEKLCIDPAGASAPPAPARVRPKPSVLKEDTTGKSPENSHSRSCFCNKPVEDSPALRGKQYSAQDREWKKIRIGAAEGRAGCCCVQNSDQGGVIPGQPQACPWGAGSPPKGPPTLGR